MKKSIYNVYVVMESQEQCDRMKQLCIDNELPIPLFFNGFILEKKYKYFGFGSFSNLWQIWHSGLSKTQVTEQEFIELLKNTK